MSTRIRVIDEILGRYRKTLLLAADEPEIYTGIECIMERLNKRDKLEHIISGLDSDDLVAVYAEVIRCRLYTE